MIYRFIQSLVAGTIQWFADLLARKESEKVIQKEQATLDQKTVEAKAIRDDLDQQGLLRTSAAEKVKEAELKVAEAEKAVDEAQVRVDAAKEVAAQVKPANHDVSSAELEAKLRDL